MIPLKLKLTNFLSYGDNGQEVNFEPYTLICFAGKNGHGKSALLDAITWALWGQARKISGVSRADEALIRLGQQEMRVVFEFSCNEQRYTVRRELSFFHGKSKMSLEFGYYHEKECRLVPLTEKTVKMTQGKIEHVIGLDFNTFTSSVFLRQGQSNEFSKKSAKERKDVLATILGLEYYDRIRRVAMDSMRVCATEIEYLKAHQEQLRLEHEKCESVIKDELSIKEKMRELEAQEAGLQKQQQEYLKKQEGVFSKREQFFALDKEGLSLQESLQTLRYQHELMFEKQGKEFEVQGARLYAQKEAVDERQQVIMLQNKKIEKILDELVQQKNKCKKALEEKTALDEKFVGARIRFDKRKELYHRMIGYGNWVREEVKNIKGHDLLQISQDKPVCPLCENVLPQERQKFLHIKLNKKAHFLEHRLGRVSRFIFESKPLLLDEYKALDDTSQEVQRLSHKVEQKKELEEAYQAAQKEKDEIFTALKKNEHVHISLKKQEIDLVVQKKILYERFIQDLEQHAEYKKLQLRLKENEQKRKFLHEGEFKQEIVELKDLQSLLDLKMQQLNREKSTLLHEKGRLEQLKAYYMQLEKQIKQHEKDISLKQAERDDYKIIVSALGKDGIQALLIESVIPEIEMEANQLLAQLSDQNAQIFIESVRDLKSGGAKETLDIKISDNAGIRPYELFSGGEAFRVDFALRIAISSLLARRAGTSLQTLIIDEGFGSQDAEGLQLIMDALYKIQGRFAKIIVVSHLPELKDHFPVHFLIEKSATGSCVSVVEQG